MKNISPFKIEHWLNKGFSVDDAKYKIKTFHKFNKEYWLNKGFSDEESISKVSEFQKENAKKYANGIKEGKYNDINTTQIGYWIKQGYSEEDAKIKQSERQSTFTLKKCIQRYGECNGKKVFNNRQKKWQQKLNEKSDEEKCEINKKKANTLENYIKRYGEKEGIEQFNRYLSIRSQTLENYIKRYGEIIGKEKYSIYIEKKNYRYLNHLASKESLKLFIPLYKYCRSIGIKRNDIYFGISGSKEYWLKDKQNNCYYFYDFTIKKLNLIFEFNGTMWHINDNILSEDEIIKFKNPYGISGQSILEKDKNKEKCALMNEFKFFKVWSNFDLNQNLNFCKMIINNEMVNNEM